MRSASLLQQHSHAEPSLEPLTHPLKEATEPLAPPRGSEQISALPDANQILDERARVPTHALELRVQCSFMEQKPTPTLST